MSIPGAANPLLLASAASTQYTASRSLRFNASDSAYLSRTPASAGNRKTWTWAGWVKRSALGTAQIVFGNFSSGGIQGAGLRFDATDQLSFFDFSSASPPNWQLLTSAVFRDVSAWLHLVAVLDTTNATADNRVRLYINGIEQTAFSTRINPSPDYDGFINNTNLFGIGRGGSYAADYFSGYLADIHFIDGQALTPSSFTEVSATTGQLIPKAYTGTFTGNSFWLQFADNSSNTATTLGKDSSGLGNNWTPNNLSVTAGAGNDSLTDTPTSFGTDTGAGGEVRGNYATLNPLAYTGMAAFSNGNLEVTLSSGEAAGTFLLDSGKYYWEITCGTITISPPTDAYYGLLQPFSYSGARNFAAGNIRAWRNGGTLYGTGSTGSVGSYTTGDILGFAYDGSSGKLYVSKNGTWQNSADPAVGTGAVFTGITTNTFVPGYSAAASTLITFNGGQRPFAYTAPSGFRPLVDTCLPAPLVAKPSSVFNAITYTGTGANATIPNVNTVPTSIDFTPDLVWIKGRSGATDHALYDSVRDVQKDLVSNSTAAETTQSTGLTAFGTNNFNIGTLAKLNTSSSTYVGWCWDAGTTTTTINANAYSAGVPSITSSVRANVSAGFSIVTYTGTGANATVGHGLGVAPSLIIVKNRDQNVSSWDTYHRSASATPQNGLLRLNDTMAFTTASDIWNNTAPTSTVFSLGNSNSCNANTIKYVAYCFAPVVGYSSFGSYTGNGSTDGPFVYTGFRPRWLLFKNANTAGQYWDIYDTARDTYNAAGLRLFPNAADAENDARPEYDILSNGFKVRDSSTSANGNGNTIIYAAFAENPFQYARAR